MAAAICSNTSSGSTDGPALKLIFRIMRNVLISVSFENEVTNIRKILERKQADRVIFAVILLFWLMFFQNMLKKSPISSLRGKTRGEK